MKKCDRKPCCLFNPNRINKIGTTGIKGRAYEVYFCQYCREYILCKITAVRPMTSDEKAQFSREVQEETDRLNNRA